MIITFFHKGVLLSW